MKKTTTTSKKVRVVVADATASKKEKLSEVKQSIDDLFSKGMEKKKERAKQEKETEERKVETAKVEAKKKQAHEIEEKSYSDPQVHRFDQESGLPVYKYFDLGMAIKGSGYTPDCPFDCNCCH